MGAEEQIKGKVFNIQKYSIHDGLGIRTNVFLKGCPLRCQWCSNPESQSLLSSILITESKCIGCGKCAQVCYAGVMKNRPINRKLCIRCGLCEKYCPTGAVTLAGHEMTLSEVMSEIKKDSVFYHTSDGGVTLSGGEPLVQWQFSTMLLEECKKNGISTAIETTGYAKWEHMRSVLQYTDMVLLDIKSMDSNKHRYFTGVSNENILENAVRMGEMKIPYIVRIPFISGVNSDEDNIRKTAVFAKKNHAKEIHLLPYHTLGEVKYKKLGMSYKFQGKAPDEKETQKAITIIKSMELPVSIGG